MGSVESNLEAFVVLVRYFREFGNARVMPQPHAVTDAGVAYDPEFLTRLRVAESLSAGRGRRVAGPTRGSLRRGRKPASRWRA